MSRRSHRLVSIAVLAGVSFFTAASSGAFAVTAPIGGAGTKPPASTPPAGGTVFQGEQMPGAASIVAAGANGGAYGEFTRSSVTTNLPAGSYILTARVKAPSAARVDLLNADQMVGSYGVGTGWVNVSAVLTLSANDKRVGVGSWVASGTRPKVDVDWMRVAAMAPQLTVRGNTIIGTDATPLRPQGLNKPDYTYSHVVKGKLQFSNDEASSLYAWGAAVVRLPLNEEYWLADCASWAGTTATTYKTLVKKEVADLTAKGVYVLVTLLATERGKTTGCTVTDGMLRQMADQRSVTFWNDVATSFKSNPRVMFDLFNEPHDITAAVWRDGGTVTYGTYGKQSFTAVGMQQMYNTVRSTGATNLIFVSGTSWASDPRVHLTNPLDGYGIVAGSHSYCHECTEANPHPQALLDTLNNPQVLARLPLTLTETGWPTQSAAGASFNQQMLDWADQHSVGWLSFGWLAPTGSGSPDVYSVAATPTATLDVGGAYTRAPAVSGYPVWNRLAGVRQARGFAAMPMQ